MDIPYAKVKGSQEKAWAVDSAVSTLIEASRVKKEMKKDANFKKAIRARLKEKAQAAQAAAKTI